MGDEWFAEKYKPDVVQKQYDTAIEVAKASAQNFFERLAAGEIKPNYDYPDSDSQKRKDDEERKADAEDEGKEEKDGEEEGGSKESKMDDEGKAGKTSESTTLFIKAIPPTVR